MATPPMASSRGGERISYCAWNNGALSQNIAAQCPSSFPTAETMCSSTPHRSEYFGLQIVSNQRMTTVIQHRNAAVQRRLMNVLGLEPLPLPRVANAEFSEGRRTGGRCLCGPGHSHDSRVTTDSIVRVVHLHLGLHSSILDRPYSG
jgi:hypothetical protein